MTEVDRSAYRILTRRLRLIMLAADTVLAAALLLYLKDPVPVILTFALIYIGTELFRSKV